MKKMILIMFVFVVTLLFVPIHEVYAYDGGDVWTDYTDIPLIMAEGIPFEYNYSFTGYAFTDVNEMNRVHFALKLRIIILGNSITLTTTIYNRNTSNYDSQTIILASGGGVSIGNISSIGFGNFSNDNGTDLKGFIATDNFDKSYHGPIELDYITIFTDITGLGYYSAFALNNPYYNIVYMDEEIHDFNRINDMYLFGFLAGHDVGYDLGYEYGVIDAGGNAYQNGYDAGYQAGFSETSTNYYDNGYNDGYDVGYDVGYNAGWNESNNDFWPVMWGAVTAPFSLFEKTIFPGVTFGMIALIPIIFGLIGFLLSLRGGKK